MPVVDTPHSWLMKDSLGTGGLLQFGDRVYRVTRWTMPVRIVRFTAYKDGKVVAEAAKFTTLLRRLERIKS